MEPLPLHSDATELEMELQAYERPLAMTPFGTPELVPDWQDTHAMSAHVPPPYYGQWIRTDLGVRTFQGLGRNALSREQVVRCLTRDAHTHQVLEFVTMRSSSADTVAPTLSSWMWAHRLALLVIFRLRLSIVFNRLCFLPSSSLRSCLLPLCLRGGGGFLVPFSVSFVSVPFVAVAGTPIFAIFSGWYLSAQHIWNSDIDGNAKILG